METKEATNITTFNGVTIDFTVPPYQMTPDQFQAHRDYLDTELRRVAETSHPLPVSKETMAALKAAVQVAEEAAKVAKEAHELAKKQLDRAALIYGANKPVKAERKEGESILEFKLRSGKETFQLDLDVIPAGIRETYDTAETTYLKAQDETTRAKTALQSARAENLPVKVAGWQVALQWVLETHPAVYDEAWIVMQYGISHWQESNIPFRKTGEGGTFALFYYVKEDFHKGHVESAWNGSQSDEIPHASLVAYGFAQPETQVTEETNGTPETKTVTDPKVMVITHYGMTIVLTPNQPGKSMEFRISVHGYEGEGGNYIPDKVISFDLFQGHLETLYRAIGAALETEDRKPEVDDIPF